MRLRKPNTIEKAGTRLEKNEKEIVEEEALQQSFDSLYQKYIRRLLQWAFRRTGDYQDAEEIVQDVFITLHFKPDVVLNNPDPASWLYKTAENKIKHYRRKRAKYACEISLELAPELRYEDSYDELDDGLDALPEWVGPMDRKILLQFYGEQMSLKEIAERNGISYAACRKRVSRLTAKLRFFWEKE